MRRKRTRKKKGRRGQKGGWEAKENKEEDQDKEKRKRSRTKEKGIWTWVTESRKIYENSALGSNQIWSSRLRWAGCFWDIPGNSLAPGPLHPGSPQGWQMVPCDTSWKSGLFNQHRIFCIREIPSKSFTWIVLNVYVNLGSGCLYYVDLKIYEHGMSVNLEEVFSFTHFIVLQFYNYVSHKHIFVRYIPNYSILEVL